ncbi:MAG: flagellar hook-basal body complex protein, partial [Selenomonadaceae bacterium]|nr:flagellar hook-basal body complex protein [Selenomonadaceae bacterium]
WEEVPGVGILEQEESLYNLNVKIGNNDYFLHRIRDNDINLDKNWTVQAVSGGLVTLVADDGSTSNIEVIPKGSNSIKVGDPFFAETSYLRFKSTVNTANPLEFSVNGINYKAVGMNHSVEIPGEGWRVDEVSSNGRTIGIAQYQDGRKNGCYVTITLDHQLNSDEFPPIGGKLEFAGDIVTATHKKPVTITTYEDVVVTTEEGTYTRYKAIPIETKITVYDSLGKAHEIPVYFTREGESEDGVLHSTNKWLVSLEKNNAVKKGDVTTYEFLDSSGNKVTATMPTAEIQFDSSGKLITSTDGEYTPDITGLITLNYTSGATGTEGAEPTEPTTQNVTLDFGELTQFASSTTISSDSDGNTAGILKEIQLDNSGIITGIYTNGERREEAQVAIAHFTNFTGLTKTGTSLYKETDNSGVPVVGDAAAFGVTVTPGALEMSNVDVAQEFADMIVTQRGFQSNSKVIMVGDEMIETAVNMKR